MSDEKPSPGPWVTREWPNEAAGWFVYRESGGTLIAENVYKAPDAALIADAPAMLELLRKLERSHTCMAPGTRVGDCPECGQYCGHEWDCQLGALLDKHGRG
jgi:hypothetical protein